MKKILYILSITLFFVMGINNVSADVVESYYIQDTSDTKSTYWNAYGESGSYWTYSNQYVLFNGTSEPYFTISTCLTGNLEMSIASNKQGTTIYSTTQVGESCDVQGYSGRMYYFIFRVNEFYDTGGNGQYSAMFDLYIENRNTYKVVQDIFTVSSSADLPNYSSSDANFDEVNDNLSDINDSINDTNEKLEDLNDNLTSEEMPNTSEYGDVAGWLPAGTIDTLINLPLTMLNAINDNANKTCSPYQLPFINNTTISIPCIGSYLESLSGWGTFISIIDMCMAAFLLYKLLMSLYKDVQKILSLNQSDSDLGGIE